MPAGYRDTGGRFKVLTNQGFASAGVLYALQQLLQTLPGLYQVNLGSPESEEATVNASVMLGGGQINDKAGGLLQREVHVAVLFSYLVARAESDTEVRMANLVDLFILAFYRARTNGLYGALQNMSLDLSAADAPDYQAIVGPEYRVYPVVVQGTQQQTIPIP